MLALVVVTLIIVGTIFYLQTYNAAVEDCTKQAYVTPYDKLEDYCKLLAKPIAQA